MEINIINDKTIILLILKILIKIVTITMIFTKKYAKNNK